MSNPTDLPDAVYDALANLADVSAGEATLEDGKPRMKFEHMSANYQKTIVAASKGLIVALAEAARTAQVMG